MGIISKIFFAILGGVFLVFLSVFTFFYPENKSIENFQIPESFSQLEPELLSAGEEFMKYSLSVYDSIFSSKRDFSLTEDNIIELGDGVYYVDIRDIHNDYQISHSYFDIELIGFGKIFIDTTDVRKYRIIPLNNTIGIKLKDGQGSGTLTELYLYPHMLLEFNPTRNRFLKNADLVRIDSVFSLKYISEPMFSQEPPEILGEEFAKIYEYEVSQKTERDKTISRIFWLQSSSFPGEELIEKYSSVFINAEKKDIYLKNKAHTAILELIQSKKSDDALVEKTSSAISKLKHSPEHYDDLRDLLSYMYKHILFSSDIQHLETKIALAKLISVLEGWDVSSSKNTSTFSSSFFLDSLYSRFDTSSVYSYADLVSFYTTYIKELGIDIDTEVDYENDSRVYLEYLWVFIENIIIDRFSAGDEEVDSDLFQEDNLQDILEVMESYIVLSETVYSERGESKILTLMYQYIDVLEGISVFLRNQFFAPDRSLQWLLQRKPLTKINNTTLSLLSKNINTILDFYRLNNNFLDIQKQRDQFIRSTYWELLQIFPEYILALEDYDTYEYTYDGAKKDLLELETGLATTSNTLSRQKFLQYMSQFKFLSIGSLDLKIQNNTYSVSGVFISGKPATFDLLPLSDNKLENISIDGKKVNASYKLDIIESDWQERARWSSQEERNRYDFSRFFVNTFLAETEQESEIFEINTPTQGVDKVILVFKRDRLLWDKGEFSGIDDILSIEFQDIEVVEVNDVYNISLSEADISLEAKTPSWQWFRFNTELASDYLLTDKKHEFRNIQLRPFTTDSQDKKNYLFWNNRLDLIGSIQLSQFRSQMQLLGDNFGAIQYVYNIASREFGQDTISMSYNVFQKKMSIELDYTGKNITIDLVWDILQGVSYGWTILSSQEINYRDIGDIFSKIKQ